MISFDLDISKAAGRSFSAKKRGAKKPLDLCIGFNYAIMSGSYFRPNCFLHSSSRIKITYSHSSQVSISFLSKSTVKTIAVVSHFGQSTSNIFNLKLVESLNKSATITLRILHKSDRNDRSFTVH